MPKRISWDILNIKRNFGEPSSNPVETVDGLIVVWAIMAKTDRNRVKKLSKESPTQNLWPYLKGYVVFERQ